MKIFAIGDPHLSTAEAVEKPMNIFGGGWENHTEKLNSEWRDAVGPDDIVIVAGDLSWGLTLDEAKPDIEWIRALPGKKLIFKGNHDLWWQGIGKLRKAFADADGNPDPNLKFMQNDAELVGDIAICGTRGWVCPGEGSMPAHDRKIYDRELLRLEASLKAAKALRTSAGLPPKEIIGVLHYPPTNPKQQPSGFTELFEKYGVKTVVYGHLHGSQNFGSSFRCVYNGVEYKLVSFDFLEGKPLLLREI